MQRAWPALLTAVVACQRATAPEGSAKPAPPPSALAPIAAAESSAPPATCSTAREVIARIDVLQRASKDEGQVAAAVLTDPAQKKHLLFETPLPYLCLPGPPNIGSDPYAKKLTCMGDNGYGNAVVTSEFGRIHVAPHPYGLEPGSGPAYDIALGPCERARIVLPETLPSAH